MQYATAQIVESDGGGNDGLYAGESMVKYISQLPF